MPAAPAVRGTPRWTAQLKAQNPAIFKELKPQRASIHKDEAHNGLWRIMYDGKRLRPGLSGPGSQSQPITAVIVMLVIFLVMPVIFVVMLVIGSMIVPV